MTPQTRTATDGDGHRGKKNKVKVHREDRECMRSRESDGREKENALPQFPMLLKGLARTLAHSGSELHTTNQPTAENEKAKQAHIPD